VSGQLHAPVAVIAIANFKMYKSPGSDKIPAEFIQAEVKYLYYGLKSINSLIMFETRKHCLIIRRSLLSCQFTRRVIKFDCSNYRGISLLSSSYKILSNIRTLKVKSIYRKNYWGLSVWVST
jgi:hypothetical protein